MHYLDEVEKIYNTL